MEDSLLHEGRLFGTALAIGLLIGLERERKRDSRGLRTFTLVALLGAVLGMLSQRLGLPWLVALAVVAIGALSIAAYWHDHARTAEPPSTSMIAMAVTGTLGVLCGLDMIGLAVPLAIVVATLLVLETELHGLAGRIGRDDLLPILQFGALTFVVLPLLPDRAYGPYDSLNPREIWLMVVLVAGVGLVGWLALRVAGQRLGGPLAAIAGGLVSSTATTLVLARQARAGGGAALLALLVLLANLTMLARLAVMAAAVQPRLLAGLGIVVGLAAAALVPLAWRLARRAKRESGMPLPDVRNPTDLRVALAFGAAYGVVSLLAAWSAARIGEGALYGVAAVSGLTDVDAITLSAFRLFGDSAIGAGTAIGVVATAMVSNLAFKGTVAWGAGNRELGRTVALGFVAMAAAIGAGVWLAGSVAGR
ncbi:MAG TPA: MgtC/SapB family protein [Burkholderiaceae bacterium]|nr:MgtC/SapB family protein [Burkholderiaceae bacterium]